MSEMMIKMYGLGTRPYFHSSFNCFDCAVSALLSFGPFKISLSLSFACFFYSASVFNLCKPLTYIIRRLKSLLASPQSVPWLCACFRSSLAAYLRCSGPWWSRGHPLESVCCELSDYLGSSKSPSAFNLTSASSITKFCQFLCCPPFGIWSKYKITMLIFQWGLFRLKGTVQAKMYLSTTHHSIIVEKQIIHNVHASHFYSESKWRTGAVKL